MEKPTLLQIFAPLLARLSKLELYHDEIRYGEVPDYMNIISAIEQSVFNYSPLEAIELIDNCLAQIEKLIEQGESIIETVSFIEYNILADDYLPVTQEKEKEAKRELFSAIKTELYLFEYKLSLIKEILWTNRNIGMSAEYTIRYKIEIDSKTKLPLPIPQTLKGKNPLDRYQTALLFNYLKERKIILEYSATALGTLTGLLTGHSPNTLEKKGFGAIENIKADHPESINKVESKGIQNYNLNKIRAELELIIKEIDKDIEYQNKLLKKK